MEAIKLDLFHFANITTSSNTMVSNTPTYLNTQTTGSAGLSVENKTFYDKNLLRNAEPELVHDQFGQKRPIPKNGGKTIEFRRFTQLNKALTPLTEGITPSGQDISVTNMTATVAQYGGYVTLSDVLDLTALDDVVIETTQLLGSQAGRTLDTITRNVLQAGTNVSYASKWSGTTETTVSSRADLDSTAVLKVDTVQQAVAKFRSANVKPIDGKYVAVIHPFVAYDLMRDPEWIDAHKYANPTNLYSGEIGEIAGVRFVQTTEAKIYRDCGFKGLTINNASGYTGAITSVAFDGATVEADKLIGLYVNFNGVSAKITDNDASSITFASTNFGTIADNTAIDITPCSGGAVFASLFFGADAYGITEIDGGGLQTIIKQKGSAGTSDPLDQRSTIGWKAIKTAKILNEDCMIRVESVSPRYSKTVQEN